MCEKHYRRHRKHGNASSRLIDTMNRYTVDPVTGCWNYDGPTYPRTGYGQLSRFVHGTQLAHRASWIEHRGPLADGLEPDHLCRNKKCMNPDHMEAVTRSENIKRAKFADGLCQNDLHPMVGDNVRTNKAGRYCVECWRIRYRDAGARYRAKKRAERAAGRDQ
jgi:hypothetical protein